MPKSIKLALLTMSVLMVLGVFLGVNAHGVSAAASDGQPAGAYHQINVYGEVLQHIQTDYVESPNMPAVTAGALRGLLESLDTDSSYLSPADYKVYKADNGGKAQVGIEVSKRFGYAVVVSVVPGSPADKANLSDGDILEAIGTQDTRDLSIAMIQRMLQGAPGSELTVAVVRPRKAAPDKVTMTRAMVNEPPATDTQFENGTIVDLRPAVLDHEHVNAIEAKLKAAEKSGNKKILLDLRDVSSGEMAEGVRLANLFLSSGTIATLEGQHYAKQTFAAEPGKAVDPNGPVIVLVNHGTAGPAELAAAAIADNKRGQVVGEHTFGEGALQKTFDLPDGGAILLSVAKYESPAGKAFEDEGVTPAVVVASNNPEEGGDEADAAGSAAEGANPHGGAASKRSGTQMDDQLNKALELLKAKA